ncbi:hypothetical protein [Pilimelia columellifera]|uniref:WD40 repeat protein n=1 Tax=Pilimelia columellifera subsp. columellifera TaxID=706583 RepID=A0ABN3NMC0_9ACTN
MLRTITYGVAVAATATVTATGLAVTAGGATANPVGGAAPTLATTVAYVRSGDVYTSAGPTERRITFDGQHRRPRWSPDRKRIAVLRGVQLFVMNADGSAKRLATSMPAAGAAWSPDGRQLAFASRGCIGGPGVYRVGVTAGGQAATPTPLFPAECRTRPIPPAPPAAPPAGPLHERLRVDDAVAWSPDGARIAFRGGDCEGIFDDCLSLGDLATGAERPLAAFGGGGQADGFAVVPAFRPDGRALSWTGFVDGEHPIGVQTHDLTSGATRWHGAPGDREGVYVADHRMLVSGTHRGGTWVLILNTRTGTRTPLRPGSQPS